MGRSPVERICLFSGWEKLVSGGVFVQQRLCNKTKEKEMMLLELRGREAKKKVSSSYGLVSDERRFVVVVDVELKVWKVAEVDGNIREGKREKRVSALREAIGKGSLCTPTATIRRAAIKLWFKNFYNFLILK